MTKKSQKPLYRTRFMLDELGNLQSDGHGISGFQTMLSIGLGQEQQFTLILQTLQQLRDVYGDSVDKVIQGNTSNIVFLKSTDDSMIDTLQKMSGVRHVTYGDSKTVTVDKERLFMQNEGKVSIQYQTKEEPVISYNDFAFISERNSIVLRAGDSPVWNRNEMILPMSWRLFKNTIEHAGHSYSLQTIPTLSSALDFDIRKNQPNFAEMLEKRMKQAELSDQAKQLYMKVYGYTEADIARLDPDVYSDAVMDIINELIENKMKSRDGSDDNDIDPSEYGYFDDAEDNDEQIAATQKAAAQNAVYSRKIYAGGMLGKDDFVDMGGSVNHSWDTLISEVYHEVKSDMWRDNVTFMHDGDTLMSGVDGTVFIRKNEDRHDCDAINKAAADPNSRCYSEQDVAKAGIHASYTPTDAFYKFLVSLDRWDFAGGQFDREMARRMKMN